MFDLVVVVASDRKVQRDRLVRLRGMTEEHADARIASQLPLAERAAVADVMVTNDGSMEDLVAQVAELWERLEANRGGPKDNIER
jgi:dephospho-CoA kinase